MFEGALIESAKRKSDSKRSVTLSLSVAIHGLVIGLALGASLWFVEDIPEPPIPVTFYAAAPPPPPPPPAAPKPAAPKPEAPKPIQKPAEMVAPTVIPETVPQPLPAPEPEAPAAGEGVDGGVEGGVPGGVLGGVVGGMEGEPLRIGGDVKAPVLIQKIEPTYPEAARKARMEGVVILEAIITASGSVEEVKVLKSVNPLLDASAVRAVQQWKYRPATLNGRAVRVYLTVTFNLH